MHYHTSTELVRRVKKQVDAWDITVERQLETGSSILVFGRRGDQPVVLKVVRTRGDEWHSAKVLDAFGGGGVVRVLEHANGAVLLERLRPGHSLVGMAADRNDDEATGILAEVMGKMSPRKGVRGVPTVADWGRGFERYAATDDRRIPKMLVEDARRAYAQLCASQSSPGLLHGDLHHYNVLLDSERGWLAIDPKGVIGEREYEVGAALRNPRERPEVFLDPPTIMRRVTRFENDLHLSAERILAWTFAQAALSAIWDVEDGFEVAPDHRCIALANTIRPLLKGAFGT